MFLSLKRKLFKCLKVPYNLVVHTVRFALYYVYAYDFTQYAHDVVLTSVRRRFNVMDVVWTSKRRRVRTGYRFLHTRSTIL